MNTQKRILAIHDLSGIGKCSLTVAIPIISSLGIETGAMPTAILSTHTGGFVGYTYRDLTSDLIPMLNHWEQLKIKFDGIYTGFLGSFEQIEIVLETIDRLESKDTIVFVDPVMADNGELYSIFDKKFALEMKKLCSKADVMIPNITEAVFMLEEEYIEGPYTKEYIEGLLKRLANIGGKQIVLTGVYFDNDNLGAACYDVSKGTVDYAFNEKIEGNYHGTGDIFGSVLVGVLLNDKTLIEATQMAVDFTVEAIKRTKEAQTDPKYGVNFEMCIPNLIKKLF